MKLLKQIILIVLILSSKVYLQSVDNLLKKSLDKINLLNCVSYKSENGSSAPNDTVIIDTHTSFYKIITQPSDSIIGARFLLYLKDTSKIYLSYYNKVVARYDWDNKKVIIDTLNKKYSILPTPFFEEIKGLLKYIINNRDSVQCDVKEYTDSIKFSFIFIGKSVKLRKELISYYEPNAVTKFYLWTTKDLLPYKLLKEPPNQTTYEEIYNLTNCDSSEIISKQIGIYLPDGFKMSNKKGNEISTAVIEGEAAPVWKLKNLFGKTIKFSKYKGKNLLIEFTGLGCGHCQDAIPFLNKFNNQYKDKDFCVISIESYSKNISALKREKETNKISYEFLVGDEQTVNKYKIYGFPTFILINKSGIIKKVFIGYAQGETEKEIRAYVNKM